MRKVITSFLLLLNLISVFLNLLFSYGVYFISKIKLVFVNHLCISELICDTKKVLKRCWVFQICTLPLYKRINNEGITRIVSPLKSS
jgi:hypothetical protein